MAISSSPFSRNALEASIRSGLGWPYSEARPEDSIRPIAMIWCLVMKTASKVAIILLVAGVGLLAAQEKPREYVANCICHICSYFFGED